MLYYEIGDTIIRWNDEVYPLQPDGYMERFRISCDLVTPEQRKRQISFECTYLSLEEYKKYEIVMENILCRLYNCKDRALLVYHWDNIDFALGYWLEDLNGEGPVPIYLHPDMAKARPMSADRLFSIIGLHSRLLQREASVLHASFVEHQGRAILFTAPSQTGKSTQADLWQKYAGAEIINGDRVLVKQRDGIWYAFGYPCCGSSHICVNKAFPIQAVVVLEQGSDNRVSELSAAEKLRALVAATEVYIWDEAELNHAFRIAEAFIDRVPVCRLSCRPDADAVYTLQKYLQKDAEG